MMEKEINGTDVIAVYVLDIGNESIEELSRNIWEDFCLFEDDKSWLDAIDVIIRPKDGYIDIDKDGNGFQPVAHVIMIGHTNAEKEMFKGELYLLEKYFEEKYHVINSSVSLKDYSGVA